MTTAIPDPLNTLTPLEVNGETYLFHALEKIPGLSLEGLLALPYSIRLLLENLLVHCDGENITPSDVQSLAGWRPEQPERQTVKFHPGRVLMQDFTGIPVLNDLAALRAALSRWGIDPQEVEPLIPVDLVVDHSIQVDFSGRLDAMQRNQALEMERNKERYQFLKWAQQAFKQLRVVPPGSGIIHQVNLENLSQVVTRTTIPSGTLLQAETLVGTDSHTTMINGLGVAGWGVGGIEALAAMLGQPLEFPAPDVLGLELTGSLREGVMPTDLALTIVQLLRKAGVVNCFVEVFGSGSRGLELADRAMIANMAPETGATMVYFPVDGVTLDYLRLTGRETSLVQLVEAFTRAQHFYLTQDAPVPGYSRILKLDLADIEPSVAGPKRPQDRVPLSQVKQSFSESLTRNRTEGGFGVSSEDLRAEAMVYKEGETFTLRHGSITLAAITSCTNTSNPQVLLAAGLLAQKALQRGLKAHPWVKASLSPGSRVVTAYLQAAGLLEPLEALGFSLAGYGCMTCIGNSGPLAPEIVEATRQGNLVTAAVLSGNRNFEGRINSHIQANYLASPPLVVAFALAGRVDIDLDREPLGFADNESPVFLKDIWPDRQEIEALIQAHVTPGLFAGNDRSLLQGSSDWGELQGTVGPLFPWDERSTYIQEPPFFEAPAAAGDITSARVLAFLGDSVTTDHISPAGSIPPSSPAGQYLQGLGVPPAGFNSYGSRRANDRVLTRATLANTRLKNRLAKGKEGGVTAYLPGGELMNLYDAAMRYRAEGVPLVILAGKEYGSGSSRDWAAKGVQQLGVRAVVAESFERIHRSNLAGMGVLPLQFLPGENAEAYQLSGEETFTIEGIKRLSTPGETIPVHFTRPDGTKGSFMVHVRLDTQNELEFYRQGGILPTLLQAYLQRQDSGSV